MSSPLIQAVVHKVNSYYGSSHPIAKAIGLLGSRVQVGTAVLAGGTVTIGFGGTGDKIRLTANSRIFLTTKTPAAAVIGGAHLAAPSASRTVGEPGVAAFVVNSVDTATGATVATDTQTFDWMIID